MKKNKILLIEKSPIVTSGFCQMWHGHPMFEVVAAAEDMERIEERVIVVKPDIIVLNPMLVDYSKRNVFRSVFQNFPHVPVVALVYSYFDPLWLKHFNGVIEINDSLSQMESKFNDILQAVSEHTGNAEVYELSDRERDVLVELAKGMMNKEIAEKLHISVHTVITHRKNIIRKTGIKSVAGLTVYAMLNNLIHEL